MPAMTKVWSCGVFSLWASFVVWTFSVCAVVMAEDTIQVESGLCDLPNVEITAEDPQDASTACEGIKVALEFLGELGLDVSTRIRLDVVADLENRARDSAAGCYLASEQRALVLSYAEFLKFEDWFGVPIDRSLYRSLVTHEAAHLIAACNFKLRYPTIQAQEYIAYVTLLATMDAAQREWALEQYPGEGYETDQQMNATIYLCDPMRFGVQAYRHFLKRGHGEDYVHAILAGRALAN